MPTQRRSASSFAAELMYERGRAPSLDSSGEIRGYRSVPGSTPSPMNSRGVGIDQMQKNRFGRIPDKEWNRVFPRGPSLAPATPPNAAAMAQSSGFALSGTPAYTAPPLADAPMAKMPATPEALTQSAISDSSKWLSRAGLSVPPSPMSPLQILGKYRTPGTRASFTPAPSWPQMEQSQHLAATQRSRPSIGITPQQEQNAKLQVPPLLTPQWEQSSHLAATTASKPMIGVTPQQEQAAKVQVPRLTPQMEADSYARQQAEARSRRFKRKARM